MFVIHQPEGSDAILCTVESRMAPADVPGDPSCNLVACINVEAWISLLHHRQPASKLRTVICIDVLSCSKALVAVRRRVPDLNLVTAQLVLDLSKDCNDGVLRIALQHDTS